MIALFDSGNSYLHFGIWDGTTIRDEVSFPYPEKKQLFHDNVHNLFKIHKPDKAAACSVNSRWRDYLFTAIDTFLPGELYIARYASDIGLNVSYDEPSTYGIDRALGAFAAFNYFQDSCVVIDAGTAITVDAVDSVGNVIGGYIFPGRNTLIHNLSLRTDLPEIDLTDDKISIGTNTELCLRYGSTIGIAGAVQNLVMHACRYVGCRERIIITGGGAQQLLKNIPITMIYKPSLVLCGLALSNEKLPKYA